MAINAGYFAVKWLRLGMFEEEEPKTQWVAIVGPLLCGWSICASCATSTAGGFLAKVFFIGELSSANIWKQAAQLW